MLNGIMSLLILIADVWAIMAILQSDESNRIKTLWICIVLMIPLFGLIIWYFAGPKSADSG